MLYQSLASQIMHVESVRHSNYSGPSKRCTFRQVACFLRLSTLQYTRETISPPELDSSVIMTVEELALVNFS